MTSRATTTPINAHWHDSLQLSYLQAGTTGPAVVLLHGWGAFKELWWSTLLALAPDYRSYALDFPAHGASATGPHDSMTGLAGLIGAFCDALGLCEVALVGHSMGGSVAFELALARPALVSRLVLVDAALDARLMPFYVQTYLHTVVGWPSLRFSLALARLAQPLGRRVPHLHGPGLLGPWFRRLAYQADYEPEAIYRLLRGLFAAEAGERLALIRQPTLVISGQFDGLVPPAHSRRIAAAIPGAGLVIIPGAMHNPMDEQPAAFERELLAFLAITATDAPVRARENDNGA